MEEGRKGPRPTQKHVGHCSGQDASANQGKKWARTCANTSYEPWPLQAVGCTFHGPLRDVNTWQLGLQMLSPPNSTHTMSTLHSQATKVFPVFQIGVRSWSQSIQQHYLAVVTTWALWLDQNHPPGKTWSRTSSPCMRAWEVERRNFPMDLSENQSHPVLHPCAHRHNAPNTFCKHKCLAARWSLLALVFKFHIFWLPAEWICGVCSLDQS